MEKNSPIWQHWIKYRVRLKPKIQFGLNLKPDLNPTRIIFLENTFQPETNAKLKYLNSKWEKVDPYYAVKENIYLFISHMVNFIPFVEKSIYIQILNIFILSYSNTISSELQGIEEKSFKLIIVSAG